jgi:hypothetical protein
MAGSTIQEFMVALGFKVDKPSLDLFKKSLEDTHAVVKSFTATIVGLAVAMEEATRRTARQFENLFFLSQQTGIAADQLKAAQFAFSQLGGGADTFNNAIQSLAQTIRENPQLKNFTQVLTGETYHDPKQAMEALARHLKELIDKGPAAAGEMAQYLKAVEQYLHISGQTLYGIALNLDQIQKQEAYALETQKLFHIDAKKAAQDSLDMEIAAGQLWDTITSAVEHLTTQLIPRARVALDGINAWFRSKEVSGAITYWEDQMVAAFDKVSGIAEQWAASLGSDIGKGDWEDIGHKIGDAVHKGFSALFSFESFSLDFISNIDWEAIGKKIGEMVVSAIASVFGGAQGSEEIGGAFGKALWSVVTFIPKIVWGVVSGLAEGIADELSKQLPAAIADRLGLSKVAGAIHQGKEDVEGWIHGAEHWLGAHFQHGGIVRANLHEGEMVLPADISAGLQRMISGGGFGQLDNSFRAWWEGSSAFRPLVAFAQEVYDKLEDLLRDVFGLTAATGGDDTETAAGQRVPGARGGGRTGGGGSWDNGAGANRSTIKGSTLVPQMMEIGKAAGATPEVIQALVATALGEGGVQETWKGGDYGIGGKGYTSFGPWQFHHGGELEGYYASGGKPGDLKAQMLYVLNTMEKRHPGFLKMTDTRALIGLMHNVFKDYGAHTSKLGEAADLMSRGGDTKMAGGDAVWGADWWQRARGGSQDAGGDINAIIGDSIGFGLAKTLGLPYTQTGSGVAGSTRMGVGIDTKSGAQPKEIYERMMTHIQEYANKIVAVSSGSNNPDQIDYVRKTLEQLAAVHAHAVLLGVGPGVRNYQEANRKLAELANQFHIPFTGELQGTEGDRMHIHPNQRILQRQIERARNTTHSVTINVHGVNDSQATAQAVMDRYNRQYSQGAARNIASAIA